MPQLVKKRRSGWAVLAVGALVASLFAVGASPAAAEAGKAEAAIAHNAACSGNAENPANFSDVGSGHAHRAAVNCLAHYGITLGTGAGLYSPDATVTRSQMSLFMQRAADVAGVTLEAASDQGFTDIDGYAEFIQDAINQLAGAGIVAGSSGTTFGPSDEVTRGEMARILINFLNKATTANSAVNVTIADSGAISLKATAAVAIDEVFLDSRTTQPVATDRAVSALAELGVAKGTSATTFAPTNPVTRAQMAAFITRSLAFTGARPTGVSIAPSGVTDGKTLYTVSIRDVNHNPVRNARVDAFYVRGDTSSAFNADGTCKTVTKVLSEQCKIDGGDQVTNANGSLQVSADATVDKDNMLTVWAWTGNLTATFGASTPSASYTSPAETVSALPGDKYKVTRSSATGTAAYGSVVTITVQIIDANDGDAAEPGRVFSGVITTTKNNTVSATRPFTVTTDAAGQATFAVGGAQDYVVATAGDDADATVKWTLGDTINVQDDDAGTIDGKFGGSNNYEPVTAHGDNAEDVTFSEGQANPTTLTIEQDVSYVKAESNTSGGANHAVVVTVTDQYGNGQLNHGVKLTSSLGDDKSALPSVDLYTGSDGKVTISFQRNNAGSANETLTANANNTDAPKSTIDVLWVAAPAGDIAKAGTDVTVSSANGDANEVVVNSGSSYLVMSYDTNDRFNLSDGTVTPVKDLGPATIADFENALADVVKNSKTKKATLTWKYRSATEDTLVEWSLAVSKK